MEAHVQCHIGAGSHVQRRQRQQRTIMHGLRRKVFTRAVRVVKQYSGRKARSETESMHALMKLDHLHWEEQGEKLSRGLQLLLPPWRVMEPAAASHPGRGIQSFLLSGSGQL